MIKEELYAAGKRWRIIAKTFDGEVGYYKLERRRWYEPDWQFIEATSYQWYADSWVAEKKLTLIKEKEEVLESLDE